MKKHSKTASKALLTLGLLLPLTASSFADNNNPLQSQAVSLVVDSKPSMTLVLANDAPELTRQAAEKLVYYVEEISGAKLPVVHSLQQAKTAGVLWVGAHPELKSRHPNTDFSVKDSEEILIQSIGNDLVVLGRDIIGSDHLQLEAGTNLAVSSFIEDQLGVRWLWPGKYGTDIPQRTTIQLQDVSTRYAPQFHLRKFRWANYERTYNGLKKGGVQELSDKIENPLEWSREQDRVMREWLNFHRVDAFPTGEKLTAIAGSLASYQSRHAFSGWYEKYGKEHPEWFALQPDGTRTPYPSEKYVKMCISNPEVADQWVQNAKEYFEANPDATTFATGENDHGWEGYCVCENCLAWDNKDAELLERDIRWESESKRFYALTDRYARFWNLVAKRLKEEFPDRDVNVSTYAYHVTRPAPTAPLEKNVIPAYVGLWRRNYFSNNRENVQDQQRIWRGWWEAVGKRDSLVWRPNIINKTFGLPYIFTQHHSENMRFVADHGLIGFDFDGAGTQWAAQGPQLYLMAKLAWNPRADEDAILNDYYQRAFGPAAPHIQKYFQEFEELYIKLAEQYKDQGYHVYMDPPRMFREIRQDSLPATARLGKEGVARNRLIEENAARLLEEAFSAVEKSEPIYRERVQFVKSGLDFITAQLDIIEANNDFSDAPSETIRKRAEEAAARRLEVLKAQSDTFAIDSFRVLSEARRFPRYLAPPQVKTPRRKETEAEKQKLIDDSEA